MYHPIIFLLVLSAVLAVQLAENQEYVSLTVPFSTHGLHIPRLGLGTAGLGTDNEYVTKTALSFGVRLIDTAQAPEWYDERGVGDGIRSFLDANEGFDSNSITVLTKIHPRSFEEDKMARSIIDSKMAIYGNADAVIDIVLLHSPFCWAGHCSKEEESVSWEVGWKNLERMMTSGHMLAIGVSNFDFNLLAHLHHISDTKISVIQNWMDPFHQDTIVRKYAADHGIVYMAYSSFGTQWGGKYPDKNPVFTNTVLLQIAEKHETTVAAVVLSWLLQSDVVAIPRASSEEHISQNASPIENGISENALRVFLDKEDMEAIRSLDGSLGTPW